MENCVSGIDDNTPTDTNCKYCSIDSVNFQHAYPSSSYTDPLKVKVMPHTKAIVASSRDLN